MVAVLHLGNKVKITAPNPQVNFNALASGGCAATGSTKPAGELKIPALGL